LASAFIYNAYFLFYHEDHEAHEDYIPKINLHALHGFNLEASYLYDFGSGLI